MFIRTQLWLGLAASALACSAALAGPYAPTGDAGLRIDIQRLSDHGIISGPIASWPLAWGPILRDLEQTDPINLAPDVRDAMERVRARGESDTRIRTLDFGVGLGAAEKTASLRSFRDTPRGDLELSAGASWLDDWFTVAVNVQAVDSSQDDQEVRADDSLIGFVAGNWSVVASTQQRWWGPGWDGSLVLSNNARPFPSLVIDRVFSDPFRSKWLSWIGPWDLTVMFGQLESERVVPDARFFGMRVGFRPFESLEIGLSRTAQWCGDGRPCDLDTFGDLLLGRDNAGDSGIGASNEPGNQMAGVDWRWAPGFLGRRIALYGQAIGEDEAGGFPSRWIGQFGLEWSGSLGPKWSGHGFAEVAATTCQFYESSKLYNCAYNHGIYQSGYRYRARSIGHPADSDALAVSVGVTAMATDGPQWHLLLRSAELNRGGNPDNYHSLTPLPQDLSSIDLTYVDEFAFGIVDIGIGFETIDDSVTGSTSDTRFYLQWQSSY